MVFDQAKARMEAMSKAMELIPVLMQKGQGLKVDRHAIEYDDECLACYVTIYCKDAESTRKLRELIETILPMLEPEKGQ